MNRQDMHREYEELHSRSPLDHHGCLILWLGGMIVFSTIGLFEYLSIRELLIQAIPSVLVYAIILLFVAFIISAVGIFRWRQWGVNGMVSAVFLSFCLRFITQLDDMKVIVTLLVSLGIMYYFISPRWQDFE